MKKFWKCDRCHKIECVEKEPDQLHEWREMDEIEIMAWLTMVLIRNLKSELN